MLFYVIWIYDIWNFYYDIVYKNMEVSDISVEELYLRLKLFLKECDFVLLLFYFLCYVDK